VGDKRYVGSMIDVEIAYENLINNINYYEKIIRKTQPKSNGSIILQANNCRKKNCRSCPHYVWKIWKSNKGMWSAYAINEPLRHARRKDFSPIAREAIRVAVELIDARAALAKQMAIARRSAVAAQKRLERLRAAHGRALNEAIKGGL